MKRGRKPKVAPEEAPTTKKCVKETIIKFKDNTKFITNPINLILHLPISTVVIKEPNQQKNVDNNEVTNIINFNKPKELPSEPKIKPANKNILGFRFIKTEDWAKSTNIKCWWCSYNFDTVPCSIPFNYIDNKFEVFGCFCSFNCSLSYLINFNIDKKDEKISLLYLLYRKIYNRNDNIEPAPKKELLVDYGGNLTIEEYRNMCSSKLITQDIVLPPIIGIKAQIDTRNIQESIKHMKRQSIINTASLDKNTNVILKREAPVNNSDFMSHFIKS